MLKTKKNSLSKKTRTSAVKNRPLKFWEMNVNGWVFYRAASNFKMGKTRYVRMFQISIKWQEPKNEITCYVSDFRLKGSSTLLDVITNMNPQSFFLPSLKSPIEIMKQRNSKCFENFTEFILDNIKDNIPRGKKRNEIVQDIAMWRHDFILKHDLPCPHLLQI